MISTFQEVYSKSKEAALENLVRCVSTSCCREKSVGFFDEVSNSTTPVQVGYITQNNDTIYTDTYPTLSEFLATLDNSTTTTTTPPPQPAF